MRLLIFQLLFFAFTFNLNAAVSAPKAIKGVIDLRNISDPNKFVVTLNGEWEFYWKKMLNPGDFEKSSQKPDYYGHVPSYWTDYPDDIVKTEKFGFATYRLTVLLPAGLRNPLGFDIPVFDSSYEIYINGTKLGGNGIPGQSAGQTKPGYKRNFFRVVPLSDSISIIINVSNYDHRRGGFWRPVKFGTFSEIQKLLANSWAGDWSVFSLLTGFSFFFLLFFLIYPKERILGFFFMTTIGLALRPLFTSHYLILNFFNVNWIWLVRFEYLGLFIVILGWGWFVLDLYPSRFFRIIVIIITIFFSVASGLTLFLPVKIFSYSILVFYPSMLLLIFYLLLNSFIGLLKKNPIDFVYFSAFIILLIGGLHDIRVSLGKSETSIGYVLTYLIVVLVFIQTGLLLFKWVKSYYEKGRLQSELEYINRNLELIVSERTQELKTRNDEIENQKSRIELQNKHLSDTILLKNRVFSVIAHDLRSPVVSILYMLNLLKEKENKEKYDTLANSSIKYAQLVINLLENMLVWGRGQEDKINYSPEKRDLSEIVRTNLSIFKETADQKDISISFTAEENSIAYFDKDLLDIIIRNLLSNAVKYTHRGGKISILLEDKDTSGQNIMLKICDNGLGISESKQKDLFASTEIESTPGTENEKGTGLGLKLCQELVKINNGSIKVESKEGEGTCFIIILPVNKDSVVAENE